MVTSGREVVADTLLVRRLVVQDDWVYSMNENVVYRRYIPGKGIWFLRRANGNKALLQQVGRVTRWNRDIIVYGSWEKFKAADLPPGIKVSPESVPYIPKKKMSEIK